MSASSVFKGINYDCDDLQFLSPGVVINPRLISDLKTEEALYRAAPDADKELREYVQGVVGRRGEIVYGDIKSVARAWEKASLEKNGDLSEVTDIVRVTIYTDKIKNIAYFANHLSPASDPRTIFIEDSFIRPNTENYQRRLKVLRRLSNGMIGEIVVKHSGMQECDPETHEAYRKTRSISAAITSRGARVAKELSTKALCWAFKRANDDRETLTNECAERHHLDILRVEDSERSFYRLGLDGCEFDVPVMIMPDPYRGNEEIAVIPDCDRGILVVAHNDVYQMIMDANKGSRDSVPLTTIERTSRYSFVEDCKFLCEYSSLLDKSEDLSVNASRQLIAQ